MRKISSIILALVVGVILWYFVLKPQDYQVNFKAKAIPGTVFESVKAWNQGFDSVIPLDYESPRHFRQTILVNDSLQVFEDGLAVVGPGDSGLLVLLGRFCVIGHGYVDGELASAAIGRPADKSILDSPGHTRLDANLQGVLFHAPCSSILPQPPPAGSRPAIEVILEDQSLPWIPDDRFKNDISVTDGRVVALKIDGSGLEFIRPERTARAAKQWLVIDYYLAVEFHRYMPV